MVCWNNNVRSFKKLLLHRPLKVQLHFYEPPSDFARQIEK